MDDTVSHPDTSALIINYMEKVQVLIYLLVSIFLVIMAAMILYVVGLTLIGFFSGPLSMAVIEVALQELLVILIVAGLIQTVLSYLKSHVLDTRIILAVGLTAMIRKILVFGVPGVEWIDFAVAGFIILVLIIGIFLVGEKKHTVEQK